MVTQNRSKPTVTYTLPPDLREAVRKHSLETKIPQSQLVAEGLQWRLAQPEPVKVPT